MKNFLSVIFLMLPFFTGLYSQEDSLALNQLEHWEVNFEETELEKWKEEKEFEYLVQKTSTSWWTQFKGWLNAKYEAFLQWIFGSYSPGSLVSYLIMAIPYILLVLSLGMISWLFVRLYPAYGTSGNNRETAAIYFSEEEKIVKSQDIQKLISEAVKNNDFRLAVRYYFLYSLQKLNERELIHYKADKTNAEYQSEIASKDLKFGFGQITRIYEFIWYGDFHVSKEEFKRAESVFLKFENQQSSISYG